jgi:hypothetical protein
MRIVIVTIVFLQKFIHYSDFDHRPTLIERGLRVHKLSINNYSKASGSVLRRLLFGTENGFVYTCSTQFM